MKKVCLLCILLLHGLPAAGGDAFSVCAHHVKSALANDDSVKLSQLHAITVTSLGGRKTLLTAPAPISVVGQYAMARQASITLANALQHEPGLAMGSDGIWSTKISIRGLNENRLVTLIDGHRMETATDLTASLAMIDVNDVDRVEVIKGAASSLYGTGAMGGIIHVITKDGYFADGPYAGGSAAASYATVNRYVNAYANLHAGGEKWYLKLTGGYGAAGDARTPKGVLENSSFHYNNLGVRMGWKPFKNHVFRAQFQRNYAWDVGIPGGDAFPSMAVADYKSISRTLADASYEILPPESKWKSIKLSYFYQANDRNVEVIPHTVKTVTLPTGAKQQTTPLLLNPRAAHRTHGVQLQAELVFSERHRLIAGMDGWQRHLYTNRRKDISIDVIKPNGEILKHNDIQRYETPVPESSFAAAGLYFQDELQLWQGRLLLTAGARIDGIRVMNAECYDVDSLRVNGKINYRPTGKKMTFAAGKTRDISWSAHWGAIMKIGPSWDVVVNLNRSYRAPSLEERFKYIDLSHFVRFGDPRLKPENGMGINLGMRVHRERLYAEADFFVNGIRNMVVEKPGTFSYIPLGETVETSVPALVLANVSKALLYGVDFKSEYLMFPAWVVYAAASYVRGKDIGKHAHLPQIAPLSGRLGIRYVLDRAGTLDLSITAAAKQDKIAEGERETPGYYRIDALVHTRKFSIGKRLGIQFFAGCENLTNVSYTNHLSTNRGSVSVEPGRNFYLRTSLKF